MITAMEILKEYTFQRPSKSRYAQVVKALVHDGVFAVKLKPGEDFPAGQKVETVQGAVAGQIRKAGRVARTFTEEDGSVVVTLYKVGEEPKRRKKGREKAIA